MRQLHQSIATEIIYILSLIASSMTSACLWLHGRRMLDYYKQHYIVDIARSLAFPETWDKRNSCAVRRVVPGKRDGSRPELEATLSSDHKH